MKVCIVWGKSVFWRPWDTLLRAFGVEAKDIYLILAGGTVPELSPLLSEATVIESAADLPPGHLVLAAPPVANMYAAENPLDEFLHPKDCIYLFGADSMSMCPKHLGGREPDDTIYVRLPGRPELNSHTAAAIFFYDRERYGI